MPQVSNRVLTYRRFKLRMGKGYQEQLAGAVHQLATQALAAYPTTMAEDVERLKQQSISARERAAINLIVTEKTILHGIVDGSVNVV